MKKPYWQPYWWRLLFRADGEPGWKVMGPEPVSQVPNDALKKASLEVWAHALLEEASDELDDLRGDLFLECYEEPAPADGTPPVYSRQVRLPGYALPPHIPAEEGLGITGGTPPPPTTQPSGTRKRRRRV